ncbi:MAG: hypothetical protein M5U28_52490 [Sandaracinaceae bacterium]|nr:hypothetical protein [Sandaracinaceae bacterium]
MRRRLRGLALIVVLAAGCDGPVRAPHDAATEEDDAGRLIAVSTVPARHDPQLAPTIAPGALPAAIDPELPGFTAVELAFDAQNHRGLECAIVVTREGATLRALDGTVGESGCAGSWDGRDSSGAVVHPGPVEVTATLTGRGEPVSATETLEVVRLGVREIQLEGSGRAPLLYRATSGVTYGYHEVPATTAPWRIGRDAAEAAGSTPLELADGSPRPLPPPWEDLESPPLDAGASDGVEHDTYNLPTAWVADRRRGSGPR